MFRIEINVVWLIICQFFKNIGLPSKRAKNWWQTQKRQRVRLVILWSEFWNIEKQKKKNNTQNLYSTNACRTKLIVVSLIENQPIKTIRFYRSRTKRLTNARDVHIKTVRLIFFSFRKKTEFLGDHQNGRNRHKKSQRTNRQGKLPWWSRQRLSFRTWVRISQVAVK